jgi:ribonucleoside-diphosphate reductase alpha chain
MDEAARARAALLAATSAAPGEARLSEVAERVARAVAEAEPAPDRARRAERFAGWIASERFLPAVPTLSNAGRSGQLAPCFVLEPDDSLGSIYATLHRAAAIQQLSGGVGIHFSRLRPRGAPIVKSGGVSPGPVAFVELFSHSARVNALSGRRPGAHLAVLRDDHPDLLELLRARSERPEAFAAIGLAVGVGDALLAEAERGEPHLLHPPQGGAARRVAARDLLQAIARAIAETGEPTLLFLDAIAAANPAPELGRIEATNPCGEQPLLPCESCVLGSLQLPAFADASGRLDRGALREAARDAVRFLDDVVEVNAYPDEEIARTTRRTRKVGLGVMGLADWLLLAGLPHESEAALAATGELLATLAGAAREASEELAAERGPYPAWRGPGRPRRNATTLAVAPTGTLRLLAGCNGGIEPWLQPLLTVRTAEGALRWSDRWLDAWLAGRCADPEAVRRALAEEAPADALPGLDAAERALLRRAFEIPAEAQIDLQARVQAHVDGAVSKTVHLAARPDPAALLAWIRRARAGGCKGVAFYVRSEAPAPAIDLRRPEGTCPACDCPGRPR